MSTLQSRGWLWEFLLRLIGASKSKTNGAPAQAAVVVEPETDDDPFVVAPGGYRIRVPQATDVNHCVGEMLPSVREGLSVVPPLPKVVTDLLREIQDPKSTAASVAEIASSDPALAASLIRTVNAAAVGLSRKISSVSDAVSYLGFGAVKSMVVRLRLEEVMTPRSEQGVLDTEDLWVHSLAVSYAADCLARRVNGVDAGFAATLGLLHDIGKLAIVAQLPTEAQALMQADNDSANDALAQEANLLGLDHAGIGANLGAMWKLPADLVQAIRFHHFPSQAFHDTDPLALRQAVFVVHIANQLAKYCFAHSDRIEIEQVSDQAFSLLGLEPSLPKLLDGKMRAAIGRAVLLADANTRRSATKPRRFLRFLRREDAIRAATAHAIERRVAVDGSAIDELFGQNVEIYRENSSAAQARFETSPDEAGIVTVLKDLRAHQDSLAMSAETRSVAALMTRSLLPNLLQIATDGETIEIGQAVNGGRLRLALRCGGLATSRRLGRDSTVEESQHLAGAELANVLNLGWFERVAISADGSAVFFERAA